MDEEAKAIHDQQAQENEQEYARSLVRQAFPEQEAQSFTKELLENVDLIEYLEHSLKGEVWDGSAYVQKYPPLLTNAGINGTLAIAHQISDKHNSLTYYDEDDVMEIMYHLLFELDEFYFENWQLIGLVQNPELPIIKVGQAYYQIKAKFPDSPMDKDQKFYLRNLDKYQIIIPTPNLAHLNLVRGIVRRIAYATIKKSYRGMTMKSIRTSVNVLEQSRSGDLGARRGGMMESLRKFPLFK